MRDPATLPKAHLHLYFTGSMHLETLIKLASSARTRLPSNLLDGDLLRVSTDQRGWFRFQCACDTVWALVRTEGVMRRIVLEAVLDDATEGSCRLEIQVDPTGYAPFAGGIIPALEIILDATKQTTILGGVGAAVIAAASRMCHPLDARTLVRLAVHYAGDQPSEVIGFSLPNDERTGQTSSWERAFVIACWGGLASTPHGGELLGPDHLREVVSALGLTRLGHGIRASEDPALLDATVASGISLEVCPASNVSLGVYHSLDDAPLRTLISHGAQTTLSADDPLLFQSGFVNQYEVARTLGCDDAELAKLARGSIHACPASLTAKQTWLAEADARLAAPDQAPGAQPDSPEADDLESRAAARQGLEPAASICRTQGAAMR